VELCVGYVMIHPELNISASIRLLVLAYPYTCQIQYEFPTPILGYFSPNLYFVYPSFKKVSNNLLSYYILC
jgi:hypothetical protein